MRTAVFKPLISRAAFLLCFLSLNLSAALPVDVPSTEVLPKAKGSWVWVADGSADFSESRLFNGDTGQMLGMISTGYWSSGLVIPKHGREIYALETHFERSTRGQRTDVVSIIDPLTLARIAEVVIPPSLFLSLIYKSAALLPNLIRRVVMAYTGPARVVLMLSVAMAVCSGLF